MPLVRVYPNGQRRFYVRFQHQGKRRLYMMGDATVMSLTKARVLAKAKIQAVRYGSCADSNDDGDKATKSAVVPTLSAYAKLFFRDYARHWKPNTLHNSQSGYWRHIDPVLGALGVDTIDRPHVVRWFAGMVQQSGMANRLLPVLSVMLQQAALAGYGAVERKPCHGIRRYPAKTKARYLTVEELQRLWSALNDGFSCTVFTHSTTTTKTEDIAPSIASSARMIIRLLLLTGCRCSEIRTLLWSCYRCGHWYLPDSKTGAKTVWLSTPVHALLSAWPRGGPYLFPATQSDQPLCKAQLYTLWVKTWKPHVLSRWKVSTQMTAQSALNTRLLKAFARYPLHTITPIMVRHWFDQVSRQYLGAANRNLDVLQSILQLAVAHGHCRSNPAEGIRQNRRRVMSRFLSHEEIRHLLHILDQFSPLSERHFQCCDIIRLLLLTGCRASEIIQLRWSWIKAGAIHLPDSKTGARMVIVGEAAQVVLHRHANTQNDAVFPLASGQPRLRINHFWAKVRQQAGLNDVRLHDLRHTFASHAVMAGYPLPMVARLLGHKQHKMTLRYAHVADSHIETAAEQVGRWLYYQVNRRHGEGVSITLTAPTIPEANVNSQLPVTVKKTEPAAQPTQRLLLKVTAAQRQAIEHCAVQADQAPNIWAARVIRGAARHDGHEKIDIDKRLRVLHQQHKRYRHRTRPCEFRVELPILTHTYYEAIAQRYRLSAMQWAKVVVLEQVTAMSPHH